MSAAGVEPCGRLKAWLGEVTYKPGVQLFIRDATGRYGMESVLVVLCKVADTYHPGRQVEVAHQSVIPPIAADSKEVFIGFVRQALEKMELHECQEWFKWRETGKPVFDPHAVDLR